MLSIDPVERQALLYALMNRCQKVTTLEAAKRLDKSKQFVRVALQMGTAPFGVAARNKTRGSYHISPKRLAEYVGA